MAITSFAKWRFKKGSFHLSYLFIYFFYEACLVIAKGPRLCNFVPISRRDLCQLLKQKTLLILCLAFQIQQTGDREKDPQLTKMRSLLEILTSPDRKVGYLPLSYLPIFMLKF